jgi:hypothetical protein
VERPSAREASLAPAGMLFPGIVDLLAPHEGSVTDLLRRP